jgi:hypothetical protein
MAPVGIAEPDLQALNRGHLSGEVEIHLPLVRLTASCRGIHNDRAPRISQAREQAGNLEREERPGEVVCL